MEVDQEGALAHIEPTARVLGLGEHGRHTVDTTVLAGGLVTLVVQFRDLSMPASTIIGLAHDLEHQVVLLSGRGHATVATIADVRAALPSNPARVLFDLEHEALRLRHKLSNSYAPLDLSQTEGHIERRSDRIQSFVIHDRRHQTTLFCRTIRIVHFDNFFLRLLDSHRTARTDAIAMLNSQCAWGGPPPTPPQPSKPTANHRTIE